MRLDGAHEAGAPNRSKRDWRGVEHRFHAELVWGFGGFELVLCVLFAVSELEWGTRALGVVYALAVPPIVGVLAWLRAGGHPTRVGAVLMGVLYTLVLLTNLLTGGRAIGANIALPILVLFGVLLSSPRAGLAWTTAVIAQILVVAVLRRSDIDFPIHPNPAWVASAIDRVPLFFCLAAALIGALTQRALRRYRHDLDRAAVGQAQAAHAAAYAAARFGDFAQIAADGFWETDGDLRLTYASPSFAHAMGLSQAQMLGKTPEEAYRTRFPDAPDLAAYMAPLRDRQPVDGQLLQTLDAVGKRHVLLNRAVPFYDAHGAFAGYRGVVEDITEQRRAEQRRHESEERLRLVADNLPALVAYVDREERYRFCNAMFARVFGVEPDAMLGRTLREVSGDAFYAQFAPHAARALAGEAVSFEGTRHVHDREYHYRSDYIPDRDADGAVRGFYAMTFDITERKQQEEALRVRAEFDALTGLANRSRFRTRLQEALDRCDRTGRMMALAYLDLDRFKAVNDAYGHEAGDGVLVAFARRIEACVRVTDTVARLAGDEFVVVLENLVDAGDADVVTAKILAAMAAPMTLGEREVAMSTSIGVAVRAPGGADGDALLRAADQALYRAKADGRATVHVAP
jgi:diguanylate cyclase (GGDEF)-like protein/PAS domain S-box-containing protein